MKYVIEPSELKQTTVDLCNEFVEFWSGLAEIINAIPTENTNEIVSALNKYFPENSKTTLGLVKLNMAIEQLEGEKPNMEHATKIDALIKEKTEKSLEELRAEAQKHGYKLTKEYPYISLSPCVCGRRGGNLCFNWGNKTKFYYHKCYNCGFASEPARTKYEAKLKWNECVENAGKEQK